MDKGTHFYKCDFQVHTPRDLNWQGDRPKTEEERKDFAKNFIAACRQKGLDSVAITDHHDIEFISYIKEAAQNELDCSGASIPENKKIIIFPGMELTLSVPCQAIIVFDADFPLDELSAIYSILSIDQTDKKEQKQKAIEEINIQSFGQLYKRIEENKKFRNRFIILPNVTEKGYKTLIRKDFKSKYCNIPCVGGYIDKNINHLNDTGAKLILDGKDANWGSKSLALFPTSDSRQSSFAKLGTNCTWVKWATPTAEALRQACLAKESRISHVEPTLPPIYITSIDVSNSKFMGPIILEVSQQYNALIGGRGTGKSTILEYLRWGLCDQPPESIKGETIPEYQQKRRTLIEKTLIPFRKTVKVSFIKNGVPHVIKRKIDTHEVFLKIGNGEYELCKEFDIRNLLPIQAYSQKQLSSVGVSVDELKRLVYSPIRQELNEYKTRFKELSSELKNSYEIIKTKKLIDKEIAKDDLELKSLNEQLTQLKKSLKGLSERDQKIISSHAHYENADEQVKTWEREIEIVKVDIKQLTERLKAYPSKLGSEILLEDKDLENLRGMEVQIGNIFSTIHDNIKSTELLIAGKNEEVIKLQKLIIRWGGIYKEHIDQYESAKKESTAHEQTLKQISNIEIRLKDLRKNLAEKRETNSRKGNVDEQFSNLSNAWNRLHNERASKIAEQCSLLNTLSSGNLSAILGKGQGTNALEEKLKEVFYGARVQKDKIDALCYRIKKTDDSVKEWLGFLEELEKLADINYSEEADIGFPLTPLLTDIGFSTKELMRIAEQITNDEWIDLFLVELEDVPIFKYKSKEGEYIDFSDASAGQQATALMHILLNQEGPPLIIDQPEEDLDNEMVSEIAKLIWKAKIKRQLIFASHNANIVVNGDAELVICCRYKIADDQSKGTIDNQGAIDIPSIKYEITRIMEGGERAFKLRKEKYGF